MKTVMIVDDDEYIGDMLTSALQRESYAVFRAYSGTEALELLKSRSPDIILLDLMLPGMSGEEVIKKIRGIPVIVISAKTDVDNKVALLLGGAADYVTKPFELKELMARISLRLKNAQSMPGTSVLTLGDVTIDGSAFTAAVKGREARLTKTEFAILKALMNAAPDVVTKSALLDRISLETPDCMESSLKVHVSNLRRKLREFSDTEYIESVWGIGFKFTVS